MNSLASHYLEEIKRQLRGQKRVADEAIAQTRDDELFQTIDEESNSIAIVMKHLAGSLKSRFTDFLTTDGEKPDRNRDQEFLPEDLTRQALLERWEQGWACVFDAVAALTPADLERTVTIRGQPHTVLQACNRALAHCAYHVGQIAFLAKHFRGAEWQSLTIPKGKSAEFAAEMQKKYSQKQR